MLSLFVAAIVPIVCQYFLSLLQAISNRLSFAPPEDCQLSIASLSLINLPVKLINFNGRGRLVRLVEVVSWAAQALDK